MPYLYIKQENEAERLYTFWLIVTALAFRRVGFLHRLGTQPSCQGGDNVRFVGTDQVLQRNASARPFSLVLWADLGRRFGCALNRQTVPSINFKKCLLKAQDTNFQNWK